jgi:hypothetical protein
MSTVNQVGGDVDSFCTKDGLLLGHTILAMVGPKIARVRCNTCKTEHAFRRAAPGANGGANGGAKARKPRVRAEKHVVSFDELFAGKDVARARRWSLDQRFGEGDVMDHPAFGLGLVTESPNPGKVSVIFRGGTKVIACGR